MKETTLCYIENDGCYLMLHRVKKKNDENKDKWIGIGGKIEELEFTSNAGDNFEKLISGVLGLIWRNNA